MSAFFASFTKTIEKLIQMQLKDPPAILLEGVAKVLRFGLMAICIAAGIFALQLVIALCSKKQRKTALPLGAVCLMCALVSAWAFAPIAAAPKTVADSGAVQTLHYISTKELAAQEAAAEAESELALAVAAPAAAEPTADSTDPQSNAVPAQGEPAADSMPTGVGVTDETNSTGQEKDEQDENPVLSDALHRIVATQTELTKEQTAAVLALLSDTKCTRTLRMRLPQKGATNVLLRLENGKRWQILLLQDAGYIYPTEDTGFLCKINDYDAFYKQIRGLI